MTNLKQIILLLITTIVSPIKSTYFRSYYPSYPSYTTSPQTSNYGQYSTMSRNYYDPFSPYQYSNSPTSSLKYSSSYQQPSYWTYQPTSGLIPGQSNYNGQSPNTYGYPGYSSTTGFGHRSSYQPSYTSTSLTSTYPASSYGTIGSSYPSSASSYPSSGYGYSYGTPTSFQQAIYGHTNYGSFGTPTGYRSSITYGRGYYPSQSSYSPRWPSTYPSYSSQQPYPSQQPYNPYSAPSYGSPMYGQQTPMSPWTMDPRMAPPGMFPRGIAVQKEARAVMKGNPGHQIDGTIDFIQMGWEGVRVKGRLYGIPGGQSSKGLHILNSKSCPEILPATQTIDHFNPLNSPTHGPRDGVFKHVGDLGNIFVQFDGVSIFEFTSNQLTLDGPHSIVNRSIIITDRMDDLGGHLNPESRKTGNSGKAIACGIITLRKIPDYYAAGSK